MEKGNDPKTRIKELRERKKLIVILVLEYEDRLKFDDLRGDERDRATEELRVLKTQLQSINISLAEVEDEPGV